MASLASINIKFTADLKQFSSQMENVNRSLTRTGKDLQRVGSSLSAAITLPLVGLGAVALKTAADMETLKTSLDTVFAGNKELSTKAFDDIKEFAATTPFQLEEVATAFIKLKNLGLDPSIDSLTSYGNTASALGKSLDQMIEAVADASVGEFERLKEFGIKARSEGDNVAFTFQGVTTTVKKNSEEIQKYLLGIGNTQFAGSIARQADTFNGKLSTLKDNLNQAFAGIGEILIDYINPLFEKVNNLLKGFQDLSPTTKKWIVILGGIAAAIGPLLALAGTILPAIGTGLALLTGPIGLIVAGLTAVGVIIYKNWKPIKRTLIDIANYFVDLYNESIAFRAVTQTIVGVFKTLFEVGKFAFEAIKSYLSAFVDSFTTGFKTIGKIIKAVFTGNLDEIPDIIKEASAKGVDNFKNFTKNIGDDWDGLMSGMKDVANETLNNIVTKKKLKYFGENVDATEITDKVSEATAKGMEKGAEKGVQAIVNALASIPALFDAAGLQQTIVDTGGNIDEAASNASGEAFTNSMADSLSSDLEQMDTEFTAFVDKQAETMRKYEALGEAVNSRRFTKGLAKALGDDLSDSDAKFAEFVDKFYKNSLILQEVGRATLNSLGGVFETLSGKLVDSLNLANDGMDGFIKQMIKTVTKLIAIMLSQSISQAISGATASGASTGAAAVFTTPAFIATAVSGVLAAFAAIPKFETGGIVGGTSFYGDRILARVNSGELILNQRQQKRLYESMGDNTQNINIQGEWKLRGEDLQLSLDRTNKRGLRRS